METFTEGKPIVNSVLFTWAELFKSEETSLTNANTWDEKFFRTILMKIDETVMDKPESRADSDDTKCRLDRWHNILQSIRNYYIEVLQELVMIPPPNIVLLSKSSQTAHTEVEKLILLFLCAAVRCDRRDHFIKQIMEQLDSSTQTGIMDQIKNFTENPDCVFSVEDMKSANPDLLRAIKVAMNKLETLYLDEIRQLLDQITVLQSRLDSPSRKASQVHASRATSVTRAVLNKRSLSAMYLGEPAKNEWSIINSKPGILDQPEYVSHGSLVDQQSVGNSEDANSNDAYGSLDCLNDEDLLISMGNHASAASSLFNTQNQTFIDPDKNRLTIDLAETKAKLRRAHVEIGEQNDQLNELHDQLTKVRQELILVKEERARLADAAHSARHWQDEVDALRESADRVQHLELENNRLKQRALDAELYKSRCEQLTEELSRLSEECYRHSSQSTEGEDTCAKCDQLKGELHKTRLSLTKLEELHGVSLDELSQLREELGKLHVEQANRNRLSNISPCTYSEQTGSPVKVAMSKLSDQLNEAITQRLNELESDNHRLTAELESLRKLHDSHDDSSGTKLERQTTLDTMSVSRCDICVGTDDITVHHPRSIQKACDESSPPTTIASNPSRGCVQIEDQLNQALNHCDHRSGTEDTISCDSSCPTLITSLQNSLQTAKERICLLENENMELHKKLSASEQCHHVLSHVTHSSNEGGSDGDIEEGAEDEADSGNKTGESTEETSPDQSILGRTKRNKFDTNSATIRYHGRKRRTKHQVEPAITRTDTELEQLKTENALLNLKLNQLSTLKCPYDSKQGNRENAAEEYKLLSDRLGSDENKLTKVLVNRIHQLEVQLTRLSDERKVQLERTKMEKELSGLRLQLSSERENLITMQHQMVEGKIKTQQYLNLIDNFRTGMELAGFAKDKVAHLFTSDSNGKFTEAFKLLLNEYVRNHIGDVHRTLVEGDQQFISNGSQKEGESQSDKSTLSSKETKITCENAQSNNRDLSEQLLRNQLNGLVAANAKLEVESSTVKRQNETLSAQYDRVIKQNVDLEAEATKLRSMLESVRTSEARLAADYYHLQGLHEQLTRDYDTATTNLKESKEAQRQLKNDLLTARTQLDRLHSEVEEVRHLKTALEVERSSLKGESRTAVMLREDCARLRAQLDSSTENCDRERLGRIAVYDRLRDLRSQLEEMTNKAHRLSGEVDARCRTERKLREELSEFRSQLQNITEANSKLEEEKKTLMLKMQAILGQNQEILSNNLEKCQNRAYEENALRERLLSMQRHRQFLEERLMEQYRIAPQAKKANKRGSIVQRARAALTRRKENTRCQSTGRTPTEAVNNINDARQKLNSMRSVASRDLPSDHSGSSIQSPLIPGSVSIYDRDPDDCTTSELTAFLQYLDRSKANGKDDENERSCQGISSPSTPRDSSVSCSTSCTVNKVPGTTHSSRNIRRRPAKPNEQLKFGRSLSLYQTSSRYSQPESSSQTLDSSSILSLNHWRSNSVNRPFSMMSQSVETARMNGTESLDSSRLSDRLKRLLPTIDRCDEKLREIVVTKSVPVEDISGFKIPRSFSMRAVSSHLRISEHGTCSNDHTANGTTPRLQAISDHLQTERSNGAKNGNDELLHANKIGGLKTGSDNPNEFFERPNNPVRHRVVLEYADI